MSASVRVRRIRWSGLVIAISLIALKRGKSDFPGRAFARGRRLFMALTTRLDRAWGWSNLPFSLGLLTLIGLRESLRDDNFFPATDLEDVSNKPVSPPAGSRYLTARTTDGRYNNLDRPVTGSLGARFARNFAPEHAYPEADASMLTPNPRTVSRVLLTRDQFIPATSVNLLAVAWLQFMIHGFFSHGKNSKENPWKVPLTAGDNWPEESITVLRTSPDPNPTVTDRTTPPTFTNRTTHWWDAAQIYGDDPATSAKLRSGNGGKLLLGEDGLLPLDPDSGLDNEYGVNVTGVAGNWWIGLSLLHTLFTREHNAICDRLRSEYRSWSDDDIFDRARLVNAALMAKIFMVDWTPALTAHPIAAFAARAGWWGLAGKEIQRRFGRISRNPIVSGIPGSPHQPATDFYAITEEFVAIYRMHPFLPDTFSFRAAADNRLLREVDFPGVAFRNSRFIEEEIPMSDLFYSFGTSYPGALTLHNYPRFLQCLQEPDGSVVDLAATDIVRTRERGVPRYNEFRRLIRRPPVRSFEELCANPTWQEELRAIYGDVDAVDLLIGLYAEQPPPGFAIADTSYRIFLLMTSLRLEADRFFTTDYRPEVYSPIGMAWIRDNDMSSVLRRHYPSLAATLPAGMNPFTPWPGSPRA